MPTPYSPNINLGLPQAQSGQQSPFMLYSPKNVVSGSQSIRDNMEMVKVKAAELEQEMNRWEQKQSKSAFKNLMSV